MSNTSRFKQLATLVLLTGLAACASNQTAKVEASAPREPASEVKTKKIAKVIEFHDAEKNDFKVGNLDLKKYSIENREDRLEFKVKLSGVLARKDDRMPEEAALSLQEAVRLLEQLDTETPSYDDVVRLQETIEAYNSNFLSPVPKAIWIGALPYEAVKMIHHSIMNRRAPEAVDLVPENAAENAADPSRVNPVASSFWTPGRDEASINMYNGFGRAALPKIDQDCKYDAPKKSYGTHGGFKLDCGTAGTWKFKFGNETKTEPFNSRVVWALGYSATQIDYVPEGTKVVYDRKLLTEYNSRKKLKLDVKSVLGFSYFSKNLQKMLNPFEDAVKGAILQDGTFVKADRLRMKLVKSIPQHKGKDDWDKGDKAVFNEKYEKTVKYFVLKEASLEGPSPKDLEDMGSWSWKSLDHPDRRELRAFGIFTAWVNAFDMRQNNNKVFLRTKPDGSTELVHEVSDLGSGFGRASNILHYQNGMFEDMPWDLVRLRANVDDGDGDSNEDGETIDNGDWISPYKFPHYSVIESNPAFSRIQLDDAKWMVRKIASFSEAQIQDALVASGFTSAETRLVLEKLLDRRQQLVDVFGLTKEFPDLMERKINRSISFDPKKDAEMKSAVSSVTARKSLQKVLKGHLEP